MRTSWPFNSFAVFILGQAGWIYRVETSTDLVNWTLLRELPSAGAQTVFSDTLATDRRSRYYRVSLR